MAGDREAFNQAMRQGTNFAWDKQWDQAVAAFKRAVAEIPEDSQAHEALGLALLRSGRAPEALDVYQRAVRLTPDDPVAMDRVAKVQEQLGQIDQATQSWMATADLHLRQRDIKPAVDVWKHIVEIDPDNVLAHERLSKAYAGLQKVHQAVNQYLRLAEIYQDKGQTDKAIEACNEALKLDPRNNEVTMTLDALRYGGTVSAPKQPPPDATDIFDLDVQEEEEIVSSGLVELTRQKALSALADALFEDDESAGANQLQIATLVAQAIDHQTRGNAEAAIANYEQAVDLGLQSPAAFFSLGLLYQETSQSTKALQALQKTTRDSDYALGAHFAMASNLRMAGQTVEALSHYLEVLKILDLSLVGAERAPKLVQTYKNLATNYAQEQSQEAVTAYTKALANYLSGTDWEERVHEMRQSLDKISDGRVVSLAETLEIPNAELIINSMAISQDHRENGRLYTATEECLWAIQRAPTYLPLHESLAEMFLQAGQVDVATAKYLFIAETYAMRTEIDEAIALYQKALNLAPMDLSMRTKLIKLLEQHNYVEQALEQHLQLADAHYELTQVVEAQDQYDQALRLAGRSRKAKTWTARILHRLGDINLQRLDWRGAIDVYQRLKRAVPDDTKARAELTELYFNLQRERQALSELDDLIKLYKSRGESDQALELLEDLVEGRPDNVSLRQRVARLCIESDQRERAIFHLDALGEQQLQANQVKEAAATIRAIIALKPQDVQAYRQLLQQITS